MAKYTVQCSVCQDNMLVNIVGKIKDREWKLSHFTWTCDVCKEKAFMERKEKSFKEGSQLSKDYGLPELEGSPKQINWAISLRGVMLKSMEDKSLSLRDGCVDINNLLQFLATKTDSRWWIDHRDQSLSSIADKYAAEINSEKIDASKVEATTKKEIEEELTLSPEEATTRTVAVIYLKKEEGKDYVHVSFTERSETFKRIVKSIGYSWNSYYKVWSKPTNRVTSGNDRDNRIEVAHKLLLNNFIVRVDEYSIQKDIEEGNYKPFTKRWVMSDIEKNRFLIYFDNYDRIKRYRLKYSQGIFVADFTKFETILDLVKKEGYQLSEGAKELITFAEIEKEDRLIVKMQPCRKEESILSISNIHDELLDG